jgi:TldD protein
MYLFKKGFYTDVRIENVYETNISYTSGNLDESRIRRYKAAFIRVYDGNLWYYSATSDLDNIQNSIDQLYQAANPDYDIENNPVVRKFEVHHEKHVRFSDAGIDKIPKKEKEELLKSFFPVLDKHPTVKMFKAVYIDVKKVINIYSKLTALALPVVFSLRTAAVEAL